MEEQARSGRLEAYFFRALFHILWALGKPFGGIRPRRWYDIIGRRAYPQPAFAWRRNRWGTDLFLSPSYHIDRQIMVFGTYDLDLHLALEHLLRPGMICLDVGANLGEMALHMAAKVGPGGTVYAFEPAPRAFERLQSHVDRNGLSSIVRVLALALSARSGTAVLAHADDRADNQGLASLVNTAHPAVSQRVEIRTQTLDDFAAGHKLARIDLIKVDIQGAEMQFLRGGPNVLATLAPDLLMEISPDDLRHDAGDSRKLCEMLEGYGYAIYELKRGRPTARLRPAAVSPSFSATNVYCTKKSLPGAGGVRL